MAISDTGAFQQVSFVNSICTLKGGTHVAHVTDQIVEEIAKKVNRENKSGMEIKANHIKNYLMVFVNCLIENPAFDSQTKETLKTAQGKFGSTCDMTKKFIKDVLNSGICSQITEWAKMKEKLDIGKQVGLQFHQVCSMGDRRDHFFSDHDSADVLLPDHFVRFGIFFKHQESKNHFIHWR